MRQEIAGNRLVRAVFQLDTGQISEILNRHTTFDGGHAIDESGAFCAFAALFLRQVVFVADVADQFLGHVFQRDDAVGAAVFVDHHGQVNASFAQQLKAWQQLRRARQGNAPTCHVGNGSRLRIADVKQVAHVHEAEHVIEILAGDGVTRIRHFTHVRGGFRNRHGAVQERDVGTRTHDLRHDGFGCVEHVVEDGALVLAEVGVGVDEHAQFVVGHLAVGFVRIEAEQPHDAVRVLADQPDDRLAHFGEHMDGRHHGTRDLLVALHGDTLRHQFGNDDRAIRDDQRQRDGGQGSGDVMRHTPVFDDRHDIRGD